MLGRYGYGVLGPGSEAQHGAIPSCANRYLLTDLAREAWGFDGYVTSDCEATDGVLNEHHYTHDAHSTALATFGAGMDSDCGEYLQATRLRPLLAHDASVARLADTALGRLFETQMRLGFFDPRAEVPWAQVGAEVVDTPAHRTLAREAADQSIVLMQNRAETLPLDASALSAPVAVVGRNAFATDNMLGNYFGTPPFLISPCEGVGRVTGQPAQCDDGSDGGHAAVAAIRSGRVSAVLLVVGLTSEAAEPSDEVLGLDRTRCGPCGLLAATEGEGALTASLRLAVDVQPSLPA